MGDTEIYFVVSVAAFVGVVLGIALAHFCFRSESGQTVSDDRGRMAIERMRECSERLRVLSDDFDDQFREVEKDEHV